MGFVSDDSDSEVEASFVSNEDQESQVESERSPLLNSKTGESSNVNGRKFYDLQTPTSKNNDLPSVARARRIGLTEADEIWGELEDSYPDSLSSPFSQPKSSARSTPSKLQRRGEAENSDMLSAESVARIERSGTGRSYRDRNRRRSMPLGEIATGERNKSGTQDALGGWWKMRWWRVNSREDKRKGKGIDGRNTLIE